MAKEAPTFWITNICNRNVSLADLNLTVPKFCSMNLLDKRHHKYTLEQLEKSRDSGSLFVKKSMISVRKVAPTVIKVDMPFLQETYIPSRERSTLVIKEERYEELELSDTDKKKEDEKYADEMASDELGTDPTKPIINKG
jgi:hypothetical protein